MITISITVKSYSPVKPGNHAAPSSKFTELPTQTGIVLEMRIQAACKMQKSVQSCSLWWYVFLRWNTRSAQKTMHEICSKVKIESYQIKCTDMKNLFVENVIVMTDCYSIYRYRYDSAVTYHNLKKTKDSIPMWQYEYLFFWPYCTLLHL